MKIILAPLIASALLTILSGCSSSPMSPEEKEARFVERFQMFIKNGDFSEQKIKDVWLFGDAPEAVRSRTISEFQKLKEQGIGETRFHEIYPKMLEGMKQPFELEGELYMPNLEPYKMIEVIYAEEIDVEHGSENGWSMVLGESEGRLYLMGYERQIKSQ
jgi:hypothetical protein